MPTYVYQCLQCPNGKVIEHEHSMYYIGKEHELPMKQREAVTCKKHGLKTRIIQEPQLAGSSGGTFRKEKELLNDKQKSRKLRSKIHFKNEVLHTLDKGDQRHFSKKLKDLPKKDHEKMK